MLVWLSFWPFGSDVGPGHSHVRPGVHSHEAWFVTDTALCDQARVGPLRNYSQLVRGALSAGSCSFPDGWASLLSVSLCSVAIPTFLAVPVCPSEATRHVSGAGHRFLRGDRLPHNGLAPVLVALLLEDGLQLDGLSEGFVHRLLPSQ
jgi:hypothetical protein